MKIPQRVLITYRGNRHAINVLFRNAHGKAKCQVCLFAMQKGRPVFFSSFLHGKWRTFFLRWLFTMKIGRKSVWSTFSHAQKVKPCFFPAFCNGKGQTFFALPFGIVNAL